MTDYFPTYVQGCAAYWASCDAEKKNGTTEGAERSGIAAVVAALLAERPQLGEMVMVPREPTEEMIRIAKLSLDSNTATIAAVYRQILAAAQEGKS